MHEPDPTVLRQLILLFMIVMSVTGLHGQIANPGDTAELQVVHIDYSRHLYGRVLEGVQYQFLTGDIELSQDSIFMYCDSAVIIDSKQVFAYDNVVIQISDTLTIYADTLEYHSDSLEAVLTGDVVLTNGADQLWTNRLWYDLENDVAFYDNSAVMINDSTQISSNVGIYWVGSSLAKLTDSVVVIGNRVTLLTDSMYYRTSDQWAEFIASTLIIQDDTRISCKSGYYDVPNQNALFTDSARYTRNEEIATADSIIYTGSVSLVELRGNAHYTDGLRQMDSERMLYYDQTDDFEVLGDAVFIDSTRTVSAEEIYYNQTTEKLRTTGRSNLIELSQELEADSFDFDQKTGLGFVRGNVIFIDTSAKVVVVSEKANYDRVNRSILAYGSFRPMLKNIIDGDTLFLTADTLVFQKLPDSTSQDTFQRFQAYPDVRMLKGTMQGLCDSMVFNSTDSIFQMIGDPVMWSDTTQLVADSMDVIMHNEVIDRVFMKDNALIINVVEGKFFNQIKGREMTARFANDEISDLHVSGNAESIYYARDESNNYIGVNRVAASELLFTFSNKQLSGIRLYSHPDGTMNPMGSIDHSTFRLDGFIWREDERPQSLEELF